MVQRRSESKIKFELAKLKLIKFKGKEGEIYKITGDKLGTGGGGTVYRCEDSKGTKLALKIFSRLKKPHAENLARFNNEIDFSINSDHPNVLKAIDQGETSYESYEHLPFYIMPRAKCDLRKYAEEIDLKNNSAEFKRILFEIIEGLIYIHDKGKKNEEDEEDNYHRDIKPENILIMGENNRVVVADFGIAHLREELQAEGVETDPKEIPKNRRYYAPEKNPDKRFDIFSLGYVIYEILTGELPRGTGQRISDKNSKYYILFDIIVDQMIKQDPNNRYGSFQEVKRDLILYYERNIKELEIPTDKMTNEEKTLFLTLLELDEDIANHYIGAISTFRNTSLPARFSQSSLSISFICNFIENLKDDYFKNVEILPTKSEELKKKIFAELSNLCRFFFNISSAINRTNTKEFEEKFQEFEFTITEILKSNILILRELEKLLKKEIPNQEDIENLFQLLSKPSHAQYFFTRLSSPNWLDLLLKNSFFIEPRTDTVEGSIMVSIWPQVNYLIKISNIRPEEIFSIIQSLKNSKNYKIYWPLLECLYNMPVEISQKSIPIIEKWVSYYISIPILAKIMDLIKKLLDKGVNDKVFDFLSIILSTNEPEIKSEYNTHVNRFYFIFSKFDEIREKLIDIDLSTNSSKYLEILCNSLSKYFENEFDIKGKMDYSEIWRPNIERKSSEDTRNLLVDEILEYLKRIALKDKDALRSKLSIISAYQWVIFIRIQLYIIKTFPDIFIKEIESNLINVKFFETDQYWNEYAELLLQNYNKIAPKAQKKILDWIRKGPNYSKYGITIDLFENQDEYEKYKEKYRLSWLRRKAKPIEDFLPSDIKEIYNKVTPKAERLKHWEKKELNREEIKILEVEELINYLSEHPENTNLGYILKEIITENPSKYIILLSEFSKITLYYIIYIIEGFTQTIKKLDGFNIEVCSQNLINLSKHYLIKAKVLNNFSFLHNLISFFHKCLTSRNIELKKETLNDIWNIIIIFLSIEEPRSKAGESQYKDYVNFAINTYTGSVILLIIAYALYLARVSNLPSQHRMVAEVKQKLDDLLDPNHKSAKIIWSIIAYNLYNIFYLDEKWAISKIPQIFLRENQDLWLVAWESYISYNQLNSKIYPHLRDEYKFVIETLDESDYFSYQSLEGLSSHVVLAYIYELEDLNQDSLTISFLNNSSSKLRSRMMWVIYRIFIQDKETPGNEQLLNRILLFLDYLLEFIKKKQNLTTNEIYDELHWYGSLFQKMEIQQRYIDLLDQVLELTQGNLGTSTNFIFDTLKKYIDINPNSVLDVIVKLLKGNISTWLFEKNVNEIIDIVNIINDKYDIKDFNRDITKIQELLTEKGFYEFYEFIKSITNNNN